MLVCVCVCVCVGVCRAALLERMPAVAREGNMAESSLLQNGETENKPAPTLSLDVRETVE